MVQVFEFPTVHHMNQMNIVGLILSHAPHHPSLEERSLQRSALAILRPPSESREQLLELLTELGQLMGGRRCVILPSDWEH